MAAWLTARNRPQTRESNGIVLALPALIWLVLFFLAPLVMVFGISFLTRTVGGGAVFPLTFENYERIFTTQLRDVLVRSIWIALLTTLLCLLVGYPIAFFIRTRRSAFVRQLCMFLVILPFWTNFLVRTYAWQVLLSREGTVNGILMNLGIIQEPLQLLNTEGAVLLGLVYGYLPFMVLPIYAAVERFNFRFVEAANDLGANDWHTFWRVIFPMTLPGVVAGCILVFIPTIGTYVVPDMLGGSQGLMIGNLINLQYKSGGGNVPLGAALSMVMMGMVMIALLAYTRVTKRGG